jgi:creatinine amidohydrolase
VNGHGGNFDALQRIASALNYEKIIHSIWSLPSYTGGDMHAGHTETSLMMHIAPQSVHLNQLTNFLPTETTVETLRSVGVHGVTPTGILGNPMTATTQHGQEVLDLYVRSLTQQMQTCANQWLHFSP